MILLLASVFNGQPKPENPSADQIQRLSTIITQQQTQIDDLKGRYVVLANQVQLLSSATSHRSKPTTMKRRQ
jgi:hypothetical protein